VCANPRPDPKIVLSCHRVLYAKTCNRRGRPNKQGPALIPLAPFSKDKVMPPNRKARRILAKARRAANSIVRGDEILAFVEARKDLLVEAAEDGDTPPVAILGKPLHDEFEDDVLHLPVRQWIGSLVKALLGTEGFEVAETGIRISGNPVFKSGATYQRTETDDNEDDEDSVLEEAFGRLVSGLNSREQSILMKVLEAEVA
jgi:hypothetical protein